MEIPQDLLDGVRSFGEQGRLWLDALPSLLGRLARRWNLTLECGGLPGSCSYVAIARTRDGARAVVKVPIPHEEALHESSALRAWDGDGAVKLLDLDESGAMLLELVEPGTPLASLEDRTEAAHIGGELLRRLHRPPGEDHPFRTLSDALTEWAGIARQRVRALASRDDVARVDEGAELLERLPREATGDVLLHGDFHHWNVLAATREPWLASDAKPMVGDRHFDAAQFLWNNNRFVAEPGDFARDAGVFADAAGLDRERVLRYAYAKTAEDAMWELSVGRPEDSARTLEYGRFLKELLL